MSKIIGHRVGACATCSLDADIRTRALLALLRTTEGSKRAVPFRTLQAIRAARRVR